MKILILKITSLILGLACIYLGIKNINDADILRQKIFWIAYVLFFVFEVIFTVIGIIYY